MTPSRQTLSLVLLALSLPTSAVAATGPELAASMELPAESIVNATSSGLADQTRVISSLGPITPSEGPTMAVFSTGRAPQITDGQDYDLGTSGYDPTEPSSPVHDQTLLELTLTVPAGMNSFTFDWYFLSREYPIYVGSEFNDRFTVIQESQPFDGNIVFDDGGNVVDVNNALFTVTDAVSLQGTGFWRPGGQPPNNADGGGTGWVTTTSPVQPGEEITLRFDVHDVADGIYDSAVLVDNFAWSEEEIDDPISGASVQIHWATPKSGPVEGGTTVVLSGRNFSGDSEVTVGGVTLAQADVSVMSSDALQITIPTSAEGATGLVDIKVTSQGRSAELLGGYTYVDRTQAGLPPVLEAAEPIRAGLDGGTRIELTVSDANPELQVWFGPLQAPIAEFVSPTIVAVLTPEREQPGSVVLRVTDGVGRSTGAPLPFVFDGPADRVNPGFSPIEGGCNASGGGAPSATVLFGLLGLMAVGRRRRLAMPALALLLALPVTGLTGCSDSGLRRVEVRAPVAFASIEQAVETAADDSESKRVAALVSVGAVVSMSGTESTGFEGTILEGSWTLSQAPQDSAAPLESLGADKLRAQLRPDVPGTYLVEFIVTDHRGLRSQTEAMVIEAVEGRMVQVVLDWDAPGNDLDLHVLAPGGTYFDATTDCFFGNPQPAWGDAAISNDDPVFSGDADGTGSAQMREEIAIAAPADGTYTVLVHHLNDRDTTNEVQATLTLIVDGVERTLPIEPEQLTQGEVWQAFSIALPNGSVNAIDAVVTHDDLGGPVLNERIYQSDTPDP